MCRNFLVSPRSEGWKSCLRWRKNDQVIHPFAVALFIYSLFTRFIYYLHPQSPSVTLKKSSSSTKTMKISKIARPVSVFDYLFFFLLFSKCKRHFFDFSVPYDAKRHVVFFSFFSHIIEYQNIFSR